MIEKRKHRKETKNKGKSYKNRERICIYMKGSSCPIWIKWKS
jgi:hypothetical protein